MYVIEKTETRIMMRKYKSFKWLFIPIFVLIFLSALCLNVSAHSGRTDASGGHYSNSGYHFHHGYTAHQHGNGICPYNYENNEKSNNYNVGSTYASTSKEANVVETEVEVPYIPGYIWFIIVVLVVAILVLFLKYKTKNVEIDKLKKDFREQEKAERQRVTTGIKNLNDALNKAYGEDYLYQISNAPSNDYLDDKLLPQSFEDAEKYSYFLSSFPSSNRTNDIKYHKSTCRYAEKLFPINVYTIDSSSRYQPCRLCKIEQLPDVSWVDKYKSHYTFMRNYITITSERKKLPDSY